MKKLSQKEVFNNGWWSVLQTNWKDTKWNIGNVVTMKKAKWDSGNSAFVLPITKTGKIIYIREFRYNSEDYEYMFPAWATDEDSFEYTAQKELKEETGYKAKKYINLWEYFTNWYIHWNSRLYLALGCEKIDTQNTHKLEEIEVLIWSIQEVWELIEKNVIKCPWSTLAYKLAQEKTNNFTHLDI